MKKKALISLFVLVFTGMATLTYFYAYFLPVQFRQILVNKAREVLKRDVTVGQIHYYPIKGFVIDDLIVYDQAPSVTPFLSIEKVCVKFFLPSLLMKQKILVPFLTLQRPSIHVTRTGPGQWNFSDLLTAKGKTNGPPFYLGGLTIREGRVDWTDLLPGGPSTETFTPVNLKARFSVRKGIAYELEAHIPAHASSIRGRGNYQVWSKNLIMEAAVKNLDLKKYWSVFDKRDGFTMNKGVIDQANFSLDMKGRSLERVRGDFIFQADLEVEPGKTYKGKVATQSLSYRKHGDQGSLKASFLDVREASILWGNGRSFHGGLNAEGIRLSLHHKSIRLDTNLDLNDCDIIFPPHNRLKGDFHVKNLAFIRKDADWQIKGDLTTEKSVLLSDSDKAIGGRCSVPGFSLRSDKGQMTFHGGVDIQGARVKFGSLLTLEGEVKTTPVSFSRQNGGISLKASLDIHQARLAFPQDIALSGNLFAKNIRINLRDQKFNLDGRLETENLVAALGGNRQFRGNPHFDLKLTRHAARQKPWTYSGTIALTNAAYDGWPGVGPVSGISGKLNLQTDKVRTSGLTFTVFNAPVTMAGSLTDFVSPHLRIKAAAPGIDLQVLNSLPGQYLTKYALTPTGTADVNLEYTGQLSPWDPKGLKVKAVVQATTLESPRFPNVFGGRISGISGLVIYAKDSLVWQDLQGTIRNNEFVINGSLKNFSRPMIETELSSSDIRLSARIADNDGSYTLSRLRGECWNSSFDVQGLVSLRPGESPAWDIQGQLEMDIADLRRLNPRIREKINNLKLIGRLRMDGTFQGQTDRWERARIDATARGPQILLSGYRIDDVVLDLKQGTTSPGTLNISGTLYNGSLAVSSLFDMTKEGIPFELSAKLQGVSLGQLKKDSPLKKKDLEGSLSLDISLSGPAQKSEQIRGNGSLTITEGYLWRLNFLEGIGRVLFIPELESTVFTDASAHFTIGDRRAMTNDLFLSGNLADLHGQGWIDFDKNIEFNIVPKFKVTEIIRSGSLKKGPSAILAQTDGYINIKIAGTLARPNYSVDTLPTKVLKKATDTIWEGVQGIFDELIQ